MKQNTKKRTLLPTVEHSLLAVGILILLIAMACTPVDSPSDAERAEIVPFTNATQSALDGLKEVWNVRPGIAIFDYDRDGDMDFYVSNGYGYANLLYQNAGDGTFVDVADLAGVDVLDRNSTGVVACDLNNDGYQDLYVGAQGSIIDTLDYRSEVESNQNADTLFINNADGTFTNVTSSAFGESINMRAAMSVACSDVDGDGWLDLFVGNLAESEFRGMSVPYQVGHYNALYRNNGDMTFDDVSVKAGVQGPQVTMPYPDGTPVQFEHPDTGELFEAFDPTILDKMGQPVGDPTGQTQAVLFYDYDSDGDQDLWVANDGDRLHVFRNDSSSGNISFTAVEAEMGVDKVGAWMGFAVGDFDLDSDLDVFITNVGYHPRLEAPPENPQPYCAYHERFDWGTCQHFLLRNDGTRDGDSGTVGVYTDVASDTGVLPSPFMPPDSLNPNLIHTLQQMPTGLAAYDFGFGATFFDYENDGDPDLYWLGSTVDRGEAPGGQVFPAAGRMLLNHEPGLFEDVTVRARLLDIQRVSYDRIDPLNPRENSSANRLDSKFHENGKGAVHGDLNGDGFADLIGSNSKGSQWEDAREVSSYEVGGPLFVWMNPGSDNNWVTLRLVGRMAIDGTGSNADGIGARVFVKAGTGETGQAQVQEIIAGSSYLSMDSLDLEFGLGNAKSVDEIRVVWPSGVEQTLTNMPVNHVLKIVEPEG